MSESQNNELPEVDLRRLIMQTLESWNAAGITHLSAVAVPAALEAATPAAIVAESLNTVSDAPESESRLELNPEMAKKTAAASQPPVSTPELVQAPITPGKILTLKERVSELKILSERVSQCTRCQELAETRTQTVFGVGNPQARVVFIGEAPGADEDEQGEPFVGRAGKLLNDIIKAMQLTREEIYICNILRCRPPGNRLPDSQEAANCREYLDGQLRIINPEFIVCWGSCASQNLLGTTETIGKMRGKWFQYNQARVRCTYHPSYLLRNPPAKKDVWEDMKVVMKELGIPVP